MTSLKFTCTVNITPSATPGTGIAGCTTTTLPAENYIVKIAMGDKVATAGLWGANITSVSSLTYAAAHSYS